MCDLCIILISRACYRNNKKEKSVAELASSVCNFISTIRALRVTSLDPSLSRKWGKWGPRVIYNVDQVPLPFASDSPVTLDFEGTKNVWVRQIGSGLDKRQCTLQLCVRPLGRQPVPTLVFRGMTTYSRIYDINVRRKEEEEYRKEAQAGGWTLVNVLWQKKAWVDQVVNKLWAENIFGPHLEAEHPEEDTILFCDNLACQVMPEFKDLLDSMNNTRIAGPKGATHLWQPVDQNIGAYYHRYMMDRYDDWMLSGEASRFSEDTLSVSHRRKLLMKWCGQCYDELERKRAALEAEGREEESIFYRAFLNTGCLVTADGSDDEKIKVLEKLRQAKAEVAIDTVEQAMGREEEDVIIYLSDGDEPESELDDAPPDEVEQIDDKEDDDVEEEDEEKEDADGLEFEEEVLDENSLHRYLADKNMRDEFLSQVDLGQESNTGRSDTKQFEAAFQKLRLTYLEEGRQFPKHTSKAYENLVNQLRESMTGARSTRSSRNRARFSLSCQD